MDVMVKKPSDEELRAMGVESWPVWEKEPSEFPWTYDEKETCYILEGRAVVSYDGKKVEFGKGDLVVFPKGLSCVWKIIEPIKKHYNFG
ncbi:DUF861 domain-containing protein [Candidatus Woesearchaeota archaeon]|nr:MAG: DUF861 domain-containing protein [Candidatus Woesearchaeota archaeon]